MCTPEREKNTDTHKLNEKTPAHTPCEQLSHGWAAPSPSEEPAWDQTTALLQKTTRLFCFCLPFEKGIKSFGEQDEIGLNRFPCLASNGSFQFLQQQVLEVSTSQTRPFKVTYVGQHQLQTFCPCSFWLNPATADSHGVAQRARSQRKKSGGFIRVGIYSDLQT